MKYQLHLRIINHSGGAANVYYSDGIESNNERVGHEMIEEIKPKIDLVNGIPANYTLTATSLADDSPLYINGREQLIAVPNTSKIYYNLYLTKNKGRPQLLVSLPRDLIRKTCNKRAWAKKRVIIILTFYSTYLNNCHIEAINIERAERSNRDFDIYHHLYFEIQILHSRIA